MLTIRTVEDPITLTGRTEEKVQRRPWATFREYAPAGFATAKVVVNGKVLTPEEADRYTPKSGDDILYINQPAIGMTLGQFILFTIISAIVGAGLSFLISLLIGQPEKPDTSEESPVYGWNGPRTTALPGIPVPRWYGEHKVAGNIFQAFTRSPGFGESKLYMLIGLSSGEIESIGQYTSAQDNLEGDALPTDMTINGKPISDYEGVKVSLRMGTVDQAPVPGLLSSNTTNDARYVGSKLPITENNSTLEFPWAYSEWLEIENDLYEADSFEINLIWPEGFGVIIDTTWTDLLEPIRFEVQYRLNGTSPWIDLGYYDLNGHHNGTPTYTLFSGEHDSFSTRGKYDIRIRQLIPPGYVEYLEPQQGSKHGRHCRVATQIASVNWLLEDRFAYPGLAYVAIEALATEQLSGNLPQFRGMIRGVKVPVYEEAISTWITRYSDRPPWVSTDILTHELDGLGAYFSTDTTDTKKPYRIDPETLLEFAEFCEEKNYRFNGGFDTQSVKAWDALNRVCAVARCKPIMAGRLCKFKVEKPRNPVQLFSMGNILLEESSNESEPKSSYKHSFLDTTNRPNVIEVQFLNKELDYERDTVQIEDPDRPVTEPIKKKTVQLIGITDPDHALKEARFHLAVNREIKSAHQWDAGVDAVHCEPGDVAILQHEQLKSAVGGRCGDNPASNKDILVLDQPITLAIGTHYVTVQHLTDDSIETIAISSPAGSYDAGDTLTLVTNLTSAAVEGDPFMIGKEYQNQRKVCITRITRSSDFRRRLEVVDYIPSIHDDADIPPYVAESLTPIGDTSSNPPVSQPPVVENPETIEAESSGGEIDVTIPPSPPIRYPTTRASNSSALYELYARETGSESGWQYKGLTSQTNAKISGLEVGKEYEISVVAIGPGFNKTSPAKGTKTTVTVKGGTGISGSAVQSSEPNYPASIDVQRIGDIARVSWEIQSGVDYYEVRRGAQWQNAIPLYRGPSNSFETSLAVPTVSAGAVELWMLRSFKNSGEFSRVVASTVKLEPSYLFNPSTQKDYRTSNWSAGTLSNLELDADGNLELTDWESPGVFTGEALKVSELFEPGEGGIPICPKVLCLVDRNNATPWNEMTWNWDSKYARTSDWNGPLGTRIATPWNQLTQPWGEITQTWEELTVSAGEYLVEIRSSNDGQNWSAWQEYKHDWATGRYIQPRVTISTGHPRMLPRLKQLQITLETQHIMV